MSDGGNGIDPDLALGGTATATAEEKPAPEPVVHLTVAERSARGRAARSETPRTSHGTLEEDGTSRDPVALVDAGTELRVAELVPIRYGRMLVSPFAFYRGAAALMAYDLSRTPSSGLDVQLCGDAHLANFGGFASPERSFVFDLNDFDETFPGPFEWDVKRLAASFEIAGRHRGFDAAGREAAVLAAVRGYRVALRSFAEASNLDVWYARLDERRIGAALRATNDLKQSRALERIAAKARSKDHSRALARLTRDVDGEPRIVSDPPLVVPIAELTGELDVEQVEREVRGLVRGYRRTLQSDRRILLESYRYADLARKVVGVGSVGTRCWIMLMLGRDTNDPLVLQVKEAGPSVLEPYVRRTRVSNHGKRVVEGQRLMQASSDIFLGWIHNPHGLDGRSRDFYVRQLWDWKTSVDLETIVPRGLELYGRWCGWTLARAHARSGDRVAIAAYLGKSDTFDRAIAEFARAYADVNERDYDALVRAGRDGRIPVATEI
jgi:uncharacterized protein (DUF2252 family)